MAHDLTEGFISCSLSSGSAIISSTSFKIIESLFYLQNKDNKTFLYFLKFQTT